MTTSDFGDQSQRANKKVLHELSARAFEHPLDRSALGALQKVPGLDWLVKTLFSMVGEKQLRLYFLASAIRVNERQLPRIHAAYAEACRLLDIRDLPELYVTQRMAVNAAALGMNKPFVVLTAPLVEMLDDDELQCVLGHELGHVLCGHSLYTTLLMVLVNAWFAFSGIPGGMAAVYLVRLALLEWSRKAELSADRAGLLVSQDATVSYRVDMKLAGGFQSATLNTEEFFRQSEDYRHGGDLMDGVLKIALLLGQTHPLPVLRVAELRQWIESGGYDRVLSGDYDKRSDTPTASLFDDVSATAAAYRDSFASAKDPLLSVVRDLSTSALSAGKDILDLLKRSTNKPKS